MVRLELPPKLVKGLAEAPANPPLNPPPNELWDGPPPKVNLFELPRAPNPPKLAPDVAEAALEAKEDSLLPPAAPKGEVDAGGLASPPKGEAAELAKLPNPDALNLSSDVCGSSSGPSEGLAGLEDMAANGDAAEVFAKPLPGGIYRC
jgi:hypothetical protein